jgi:glycosyltransferase involved in cell wall biosynthesis
MGRRLPISIVMIARNEELNLPRSLGSVCDWVEELVVVINDCEDDTARVAREFGARVIEHSWISYVDQKNFAIKQANSSWVFSLDADEEVSPELRRQIETAIDTIPPQICGIRFPRLNRFLGRWMKHGDWYPDMLTRMFRNGSGKFTGTFIHEKLEVEGEILTFSGDLLHYPYDSMGKQIDKISHFANYFAAERILKKRRWGLCETLFRPLWRFVRAYILRRGFLDGFPGFYLAVETAFSTFARYGRLYEAERLGVEIKEFPKLVEQVTDKAA